MLAPEKLIEFGKKLDAIYEREMKHIGKSDAEALENFLLKRKSDEFLGRILAGFGLDPVSFVVAVYFLATYRLKDSINHAILHNTYNNANIKKYLSESGLKEVSKDSASFKEFPVPTKGWRHSHNKLHHYNPNIESEDPDTSYDGFYRFHEKAKHKPVHRFQAIYLFGHLLVFGEGLGFYNMGYRKKVDGVWRQCTDKDLAKEFTYKLMKRSLIDFLLYPLIFWPNALRVFAINLISKLISNFLLGLYVLQGHHSNKTEYLVEKNFKGKYQLYYHQIVSSNNFYSSFKPLNDYYINTSCGLNFQIEHHLFPDLSPERLKKIAPEVESLCKEYGVKYNKIGLWKGSWLTFKNLIKFSRKN